MGGLESLQPILCSTEMVASMTITGPSGMADDWNMFDIVGRSPVCVSASCGSSPNIHTVRSRCKIRNVSFTADINTDWWSANKTSQDKENELINATKSTRFAHLTPEFPQRHSERCSRLGKEDWREALSRLRSCPHAEKRHFVTKG